MILALRQPEFLMEAGEDSLKFMTIIQSLEAIDQPLYNTILDRFQSTFGLGLEEWFSAECDMSWVEEILGYQLCLSELLVMAAGCQELIDKSEPFSFMEPIQRHQELSGTGSGTTALSKMVYDRLAKIIEVYSTNLETGVAVLERDEIGRLVKNGGAPVSPEKGASGAQTYATASSPSKGRRTGVVVTLAQRQALTDLKCTVSAWFLLDTPQASALYPFYKCLKGLTEQSDPVKSSLQLAKLLMRLKLEDS